MNKLWISLACIFIVACAKNTPQDLVSPDKHLQVRVSQGENGSLRYTVARDGKTVLKESALGLALNDADFTNALTIKNTSAIKTINDDYEMMVGKKHKIHYSANEQTYTVKNAAGQELMVTFRVSNDGVAFRYQVPNPDKKLLQFKNETTSFAFSENAKAWLQPVAVAQTGFANTNPSYEEHYLMDIAVGTASPSPAGWVFPALYKIDDTWERRQKNE